MGLDCTALSHMAYVGTHTPGPDGYCEEDGHWAAFAYDGFERSTRGLKGMGDRLVGPGFKGGHCYAETPETEAHGFRAGSYGGHGQFRQALAEVVGATLEDYWHGDDFDLPFYELINFADNEGTIGPEAAGDLLADLRKYRDAFREAFPAGGSWFAVVYDDWTTACELASQDGLISFH